MAEAIGIIAIVLGTMFVCWVIDSAPIWWDELMDTIFNNR